MQLQEWIDAKIEELTSEKGYRKAELRNVRPAKFSRHSYCFELFSRKQVALDTQVKEIVQSELPDARTESGMAPGVIVYLDVVPPRCRKARLETFDVLTCVR